MISLHLNKLYNSTFLSKDIINIIQIYLLPDINKIKLNKEKYMNKLKENQNDLRIIIDYTVDELTNYKYKNYKYNNDFYWFISISLK